MAIIRQNIRVDPVFEDGAVELYIDWDYDDVLQQGTRLYGYRVNNQTTQNLVYLLVAYGRTRQTGAPDELFRAEYLPATDTGYTAVGPFTLRGGGFGFNFTPLRYAD